MHGPSRRPPISGRRPGLAVASVCLLLGAACSAGARGSSAPATTTSTRATTTLPGSVGTSTTAPPVTLRLGDDHRTAEGNTVRVVAYVQPVRQTLVAPGPTSEFAAVDAEICAGRRGARRVTAEAFAVELGDGTRIGRSFLGPQGPLLADARLAADECVRGWVNFELPTGERPAFVVFRGSSVVQWTVSGRST